MSPGQEDDGLDEVRTQASALDPLCESLVELASKALAAGDIEEAAEALEALLDVVPTDHAKRGEVESLAALVRAAAKSRRPTGDRAPKAAEVVDPALSAGYLLMAAQDGELTPEEAATLEERLGPADAALRVEWGWLERARGALGRVATYEPAEGDPLWARLKSAVRLGLEAPTKVPEVDRSELERMRSEMERQAAEMRALLSGLAGTLSTAGRAPTAGGDDVARQLRAMQTSLADQLRRSMGTLGKGSGKEFDLSPEAAAALFASGTGPSAPAARQRTAKEVVEALKGSGASAPPRQPPRAVRTARVEGSLEIATLHLPAAEPFGDVVDVSRHPGGVDVVLLDPSGRGPDAKAVGLAAQVGLQAALGVGATPVAAIQATNRALHGATARDMFVAGTLVRWDEARGVAVLAGAGGEDAVVRRARRGSAVEVQRLKAAGVVLGAVAEAPAFPPREVELAPGDVLLLVSDGFTEQKGRDGQPYCDGAWTRLLGLVEKLGHLEAVALVATLEAELRAWGGFERGAPADDVVVVALRRRRDLVTTA